jgi:hypothetical protein
MYSVSLAISTTKKTHTIRKNILVENIIIPNVKKMVLLCCIDCTRHSFKKKIFAAIKCSLSANNMGTTTTSHSFFQTKSNHQRKPSSLVVNWRRIFSRYETIFVKKESWEIGNPKDKFMKVYKILKFGSSQMKNHEVQSMILFRWNTWNRISPI